MSRCSRLALVAGVLALCTGAARADEPWVFEWELAYAIPSSTSRLLHPGCGKVVPVELAEWYAADPRPGWTISCGNQQPMYLHFLGRRCGRLGRVVFECGWRHLSSPGDQEEIEFDALVWRGRFSW